jgi:hypothetical protein
MIDRVPRLVDEAIKHWISEGQDVEGWMKFYPHRSGEHIKLTIGFYDTAKGYVGLVTVTEDARGAELQTTHELDPQKDPEYWW